MYRVRYYVLKTLFGLCIRAYHDLVRIDFDDDEFLEFWS